MSSTRRSFLKTGTLAATGLVSGLELPQGLAGKVAFAFEPNACISITPDNIVRLWITRSEMGQGVRTALTMMLAEELESELVEHPVETSHPWRPLQRHSLAHNWQREQRLEPMTLCAKPEPSRARCWSRLRQNNGTYNPPPAEPRTVR